MTGTTPVARHGMSHVVIQKIDGEGAKSALKGGTDQKLQHLSPAFTRSASTWWEAMDMEASICRTAGRTM